METRSASNTGSGRIIEMENIRIGIDCRDGEYAGLLAEKLAGKGSNLAIYVFDGKKACRDDVDVLLTDHAFEEKGMAERKMPAVFLHEKKILPEEEEGGEKAVCMEHTAYRYGRVSEILRAAVDAYTDVSGNHVRIRGKNRIPIIGIVSSSGGNGCSLLSGRLAEVLGRKHGKRVLVLTLDEFEADHCPEHGGYGMREYIFYLEEGNPEKLSAEGLFTYEDDHGTVRFGKGRGPNPLTALSEEKTAEVVESLVETGGFDAIVFDIGGACCERQLSAMECCDHLIHICGRKDREYLDYMESRIPAFETCTFVENRNESPDLIDEAGYENAEKVKIPALNACGDEYAFEDAVESILKRIMKN